MSRTTNRRKNNKPRALSIDELREQMVERGDVSGLFRVLRDSESTMISIPDVGKLLLRAVEVRVRANPARFADEIYQEIVGFVGFMVLQGQVHATKMVRRLANEEQNRGVNYGSDELRELMVELMSLQRHAVEIAQIHAATQRLRQLSRRTELEIERLERTQRRRHRSPKRVASPAQTVASAINGGGINRIASLLDEI